MQKNSLEIEMTAYAGGAGAFGVFVRWLQDQTAFDDANLPVPSVWHFAVPLLILAAAFLFIRSIDKLKKHRYYGPEEYREALENPGMVFKVLRIAAGALMAVGGLLLFASCETDTHAVFLKILSAFAVLSGVAFPFALGNANKEDGEEHRSLTCVCAALPIVMFAVWLITCYKMNDINSVIWEYAIEMLACAVCMGSFFRSAGFAYHTPDTWRAVFFDMMGALLCIMALADERYFGMQLMFASSAVMLLLYNWVLLRNLRQKEAASIFRPDDGFEHL